MKQKGNILIFLILLFILLLFNSHIGSPDLDYKNCAYKMFLFIMVWSVLSLLFKRYNAICEWCFILIIAIWAGIEVYTGFMQIYGFSPSKNNYFILTGSFNNPGPYGGFLSTCVCVMAGWMFKVRNDHRPFMLILFCLCAIVTITSLSFIVLSHSRASLLSLCVCSLFFIISFDKGRLFLRKYLALIILTGLVGGTIAFWAKRESAIGRLMTYKICVQTIRENGLKGAGLGHFSGAYVNTQKEYFSKHITQRDGILNIDKSIDFERQHVGCPDYAFNDMLQIGVESGPVTMILYIFIIVISFTKLYRASSPFAYGLLSIAVFGFFSYPLFLWQFQLLLTLFVSSVSIPNRKGESYSFIVTALVSSVFICFNCKNMTTTGRLCKEWMSDRYFFNIEEYELYAGYCNDKYGFLNYIKEYMIEYAYSLSMIDQLSKSDSIIKEMQVSHNNPRALLLKGDNSLKRADYDLAEQCYFEAFLMLPDRLTPLHKLAQLYYDKMDTIAFKNMAKSIDEFHPRIESSATNALRFEVKELERNLNY